MISDSDMLDFLEAEAGKPGGLLLHDGSEHGRLGIGLLGTPLRERLKSIIGIHLREGGGKRLPRRSARPRRKEE